MLEKAIEIAAKAHAGQPDLAGQPYILHPLRVMFQMTGEYEQITAVLHDVVEDSSVTLDALRSYGFPEPVIEAVDALTKRGGEKRIEAAKRALLNPIARKVKIADVRDNMDLIRIPNPTAKDLARVEEYKAVLQLLTDGGPSE
jgi:GTP diphosphokinase / guanosine-3',5'-bis(diphosphate) 3'-diphosphatase